MGLSFLVSNSIFDARPAASVGQRKFVPRSPNPDPAKFEILADNVRAQTVLLLVRYPNCTTYEGRKILLYEKVPLKKLLGAKLLDPHFSTSKKHPSPIARFEPTDRGWRMGIAMQRYLAKKRK